MLLLLRFLRFYVFFENLKNVTFYVFALLHTFSGTMTWANERLRYESHRSTRVYRPLYYESIQVPYELQVNY